MDLWPLLASRDTVTNLTARELAPLDCRARCFPGSGGSVSLVEIRESLKQCRPTESEADHARLQRRDPRVRDNMVAKLFHESGRCVGPDSDLIRRRNTAISERHNRGT